MTTNLINLKELSKTLGHKSNRILATLKRSRMEEYSVRVSLPPLVYKTKSGRKGKISRDYSYIKGYTCHHTLTDNFVV